MSEKTAKALVTAAAAGIGIYGLVLRPSAGGVDKYRYLGAVALVFVFLSLLADISPEVAGPLALLLALAVYARYLAQRGAVKQKPGANAAGTTIIAPSTGG